MGTSQDNLGNLVRAVVRTEVRDAVAELRGFVDRRIAVLGTPAGAAKEARAALALAAGGRGRPVATVVPFEDIDGALALARSGVRGKIVLDLTAGSARPIPGRRG